MTERIPREGIAITPDVRVYPRLDGKFVIIDKRLALGFNAGVFEDGAVALEQARQVYAAERVRPATKQSASDDEAFAMMRVAMANGFSRHEPACSAEQYAADLARGRA